MTLVEVLIIAQILIFASFAATFIIEHVIKYKRISYICNNSDDVIIKKVVHRTLGWHEYLFLLPYKEGKYLSWNTDSQGNPLDLLKILEHKGPFGDYNLDNYLVMVDSRMFGSSPLTMLSRRDRRRIQEAMDETFIMTKMTL